MAAYSEQPTTQIQHIHTHTHVRCNMRAYTVKQSNCIGGDGEKHLKRIKMPYIIFLIIGSMKFLLMRSVFFLFLPCILLPAFLLCFVQCMLHFFYLPCVLLFFIIISFQWNRLNFDDSFSNTANSSNGLNMDFAFHVISTERRNIQTKNKQTTTTTNKNMNNTSILNVRLFMLRTIEMNSAAFFLTFLSHSAEWKSVWKIHLKILPPYYSGKTQWALVFDVYPTCNSNNPCTSDG